MAPACPSGHLEAMGAGGAVGGRGLEAVVEPGVQRGPGERWVAMTW